MDKARITPPKTDFRWLWVTLLILAIIIISFNLGKQTNIVANSLGVKKVGIVEITGPIISSKKIIEDLNQLEQKEDIASIVIRIDSPGGSVAPTEEIYEKINKVKKTKPVIASVGNVAASGGYYIAVAADSIFANKGSILGSIGVIISYPIFKDLFDKVGIDIETIKSGNLKDSGSFSRNPTPQDKIFFEKLILNMYNQFIDVVVKERMIERNNVLSLADGRVFTGLTSMKLGLIDELGTFESAIEIAAEMGGISGKPQIFQNNKKSNIVKDFLSSDLSTKIQTTWFEKLPQYRWRME